MENIDEKLTKKISVKDNRNKEIDTNQNVDINDLIALLDTPFGQSLMREVFKTVAKNFGKKYIGKALISKGSDYFVDNIFTMTKKRDLKRLRKRKYKVGKRKYKKEILPQKEMIIKNQFKNMIISKLSKHI